MGNNLRHWMFLVEGGYAPFKQEFYRWLENFNASAGPVHVDIVGFRNAATIESITSDNKNHGYATEVMRILCALADKYHIALSLQPVSYADYGEAEGGLGMDDLVSWYERFGFEMDSDGLMHRR